MEAVNTKLYFEHNNDFDIETKSQPKVSNDFRAFEDITNFSIKEEVSSFDFSKRGFLAHESWNKTINLHARIIQKTASSVVCECIVDKENRIFETRVFPEDLFEHLRPIKKDRLILINIRTKPGSSRIDIYDGKDVVNENYFNVEDGWKNLMDDSLNKPFRIDND